MIVIDRFTTNSTIASNLIIFLRERALSAALTINLTKKVPRHTSNF